MLEEILRLYPRPSWLEPQYLRSLSIPTAKVTIENWAWRVGAIGINQSIPYDEIEAFLAI